tara:strand:+ start:954 stop:1706 length:753 start_codon:yes stop_codon:yes gene_type:complete
MGEELKNKVAIITGSYGDIGNAIAENLIASGTKVALLGRNNKKLQSQKKQLEKINSTEIDSIECDVKDSSNFKAAIDRVFSNWDRIDVLINNAGVTNDNIVIRMKDDEWENVINTNLKGTFLGCKLVSKYMIKQKYGRIINISSIIGQIGNKGQSNYAASKAGIDAVTKSLSKELGSRGITINSIAPGYIETGMTSSLPNEIKENMLKSIPLNRFGDPSDVASLVNFLISKNASYITGQIINLDGGMVTQ